jgi:hypothetical protein
VNQLGPLVVADACAIVQQAALGLQHAHESGRVHRDIKPSNLILWNSGASEMASVKIVDFGLALLVHRADGARNLTGSGQIMGTLDYMAPEQGDDSHEVDHRADIYSLGATLYKLLSGESPLAAPATASPLQKVAALALGESIPLRDRRPDLPETIANLVDRLLDRNPANRPATAAEIAAQLEPFARTANLSDLLRMAREPGGEKRGSPSRTAKSSSIGRAKTLWIRRIVPTAIGVALMLLAATVVVRIATDKGELVIQSPDPNVKITVKRNGKPVEELELIAGESNVRVRSGEVEVILKGASIDKYEIKNDRFTLSRGDKPVIEITRKALANTQPTEANADRLVAEWVLSVGGWVCIDKERKEIKTESDLPKGQFTTTDVFVPRNRSVGDAEVLRLRGLTGLIVLDISETRVADNGIAQLSVHKGLGGLRAHGTLLTNMGVEHLKELKDLQYLKLGATAITDDALRHIKELPKLSDLGVQITAVSDAGLEHLRDQMSLTRLQLFKTRVSDDGLVHLYRLTRLVEVDVRETRVTAKGVSELRKALPKCKVIAD